MSGRRSSEADVWRKLYNTAKWIRLSKAHRRKNPRCVFCKRRGVIRLCDVADHIIPHKGDQGLFFDPKNLQSLCHECHSSDKAIIEAKGYLDEVGPDGIPIDPNHPFNQ